MLGTATLALAVNIAMSHVLLVLFFNGTPKHAHASVFLDLLYNTAFILKCMGVCLILTNVARCNLYHTNNSAVQFNYTTASCSVVYSKLFIAHTMFLVYY